MVLSQKVALFLLLIGSVYHCSSEPAPSETSFLIEKPTSKNMRLSPSQARREAIGLCESLGHTLTKEIKALTELLDDVMLAVRDLVEGNAETASMKLLRKDKQGVLNTLQIQHKSAKKRIDEIQECRHWLTQIPNQEKSKP